MSASHATGRCLCGGVRFTIAFPTNWVAHCHCTYCRGAHNAAFVTWASVPEAQFNLDDPDHLLRDFASSPPAVRSFCGRCGSPLIFRSSRWPGEVHVARAAIAGPIDRLPQVHAYFDTHVDWFTVNDALPKKPPVA